MHILKEKPCSNGFEHLFLNEVKIAISFFAMIKKVITFAARG